MQQIEPSKQQQHSLTFPTGPISITTLPNPVSQGLPMNDEVFVKPLNVWADKPGKLKQIPEIMADTITKNQLPHKNL